MAAFSALQIIGFAFCGAITVGSFGWLLGYHLLGDAAPDLGQEGR